MKNRVECHQENLLLYHYGELQPEEKQALDMHLQGCDSCRNALQEIEGTLAVIPKSELKLSAARKQQLSERVIQRSRLSPLGLRPAWAIVVIALLVGALVLMRQGGVWGPPGSPATPMVADFEVVEQIEMLQTLDLLENLDLLEEIESAG